MEPGETIPQRKTEPKRWTRRSLHRYLEIAIATLYKWELEIHSNLPKTLTHSFKIWRILKLQEKAEKKKYPPLDDYQVECILLLAKLRKDAAPNDTIADTIRDNSYKFYLLHKQFSPYHKEPKTNGNQQENPTNHAVSV
jgi:hypothetical protein